MLQNHVDLIFILPGWVWFGKRYFISYVCLSIYLSSIFVDRSAKTMVSIFFSEDCLHEGDFCLTPGKNEVVTFQCILTPISVHSLN